jgi:peptidoglycan/LPS O-acetylase OafA/YrhL
MAFRTEESENNFTLLRLLLALMVVLGHFRLLSDGPDTRFPFNLADAAVDSFFVVSGYLITLSHERSRGLWSFYTRRVFRLYPMYCCAVLMQAAIMLALLPGGPLSEPQSTLRYLSANLVLANFVQYDIGGVLAGLRNPGINPSLWTLKIELGFYLIVPLICVATRRWGWPVLAGIFVASVAYNLAMLHIGDPRLAKQLPGQLQFFVTGMALWFYGERLRVHWLGSVVIAIAFVVAWSVWHPIPPGIRPLLVAAFVYSFALYTPVIPLRRDISYSVYLLHGPLLQTLILLGLLQDNLLFLAGVVAAVVGLSLITERLVERPGNALGHRLARRIEQRTVAATSPA